MSEARLIVVFGATGKQGGSVCRYVLESQKFRVRPVVRDPASAKAHALAKQGAEVVKGDLDSLTPSLFEGAYAIFGFTASIFNPARADDEIHQGKAIAQAAIAAGVQVFLWSSLPDTRQITGNTIECAIYTRKNVVWEYIQTLGFRSAVALDLSGFYENLEAGLAWSFTRNEDGTATFKVPLFAPTDKLNSFSVHETGLPVVAILENPDKYNGQRISYAGCDDSISHWADAFTKATGVKVSSIVSTPYDTLAQVSKDYANMFLYVQKHGYYGDGHGLVDASQVAGKPLTDLHTWFRESSVAKQFAV